MGVQLREGILRRVGVEGAGDGEAAVRRVEDLHHLLAAQVRGRVVAELGHDEVAAVGGRREGVHLCGVARQVVARDVGREEVEDGLRRRALAGLSRPGGNDERPPVVHGGPKHGGHLRAHAPVLHQFKDVQRAGHGPLLPFLLYAPKTHVRFLRNRESAYRL